MADAEKEDAGVANKSKKRVSQAKRIISLVSDEGVVLFHDETRTAYACVPVDSHFETWPCDGRDFRDWLAGLVWRRGGEAPGSEALNAALNVLRAKARYDGEKQALYNRVAFHDGVIYYDLADQEWRAVKITPQGWSVVDNPPVRFRRYSHQAPQVTPSQTGSDLRDVLRFVNLKDDSQGLLLLAYIVTCLVPDIPHPVIVFHGPQGSAKTTVLEVIRYLVDPSTIKVLSPPGDLKELVQQLSHHYAPYFDNLSDLPRWESDAFCRAVTGEGFSKRQLYTDDEDVIYSFRRCLGMSGVNVAAYQPDLLDRCMLIELEWIDGCDRRTVQAIRSEFKRVRPKIVGALFDALARAMALFDDIDTSSLPRMADFAQWGCAVAAALGRSPEEFLKAYADNASLCNEEALENSPVSRVIKSFIGKRGSWRGTASDLLDELQCEAVNLNINTRAKAWPNRPNVLARRLNEIKPNLAQIGIQVSKGRDSRHREIRISANGVHAPSDAAGIDLPDLDNTELAPLSDDDDAIQNESSQISSQRKPSKHAGLYGNDDNDDTSTTFDSEEKKEREGIGTSKSSDNTVITVTTVPRGLTSDGSIGSMSTGNDGNYDGTGGEPDTPSHRVLPACTLEWPEDVREQYEERAAIIEFDGGLSREEAEMSAETALRQLFAASEGGVTQGVGRDHRLKAVRRGKGCTSRKGVCRPQPQERS